MGTLYLEEQAAPSTPSASKVVMYPKTDGRLYSKDDAGTESALGGGGTLATEQATTSGTSKDFTGIPSWVKKITIMYDVVSTNGTSNHIVQIGDSGGVETTTYTSAAWQGGSGDTLATSTIGFIVSAAVSAATTYTGTVVLVNMSGNKWIASGVMVRSDGAGSACSGAHTLSATLDRVRVTMVNGTDAYDAGNVNILYE
jgi:hypothetical protein